MGEVAGIGVARDCRDTYSVPGSEVPAVMSVEGSSVQASDATYVEVSVGVFADSSVDVAVGCSAGDVCITGLARCGEISDGGTGCANDGGEVVRVERRVSESDGSLTGPFVVDVSGMLSLDAAGAMAESLPVVSGGSLLFLLSLPFRCVGF